MPTELSKEEEQFVNRLLIWDKKQKPIENIFYYILLILGVVIIVVVSFFTFKHLFNRIILIVTVPGFLTGILIIWLFFMGKRRIKEYQLITSILKKLYAQD